MHDLQGATVQQLIERCLPVAPEGISVTWEQDQARHGLLIRHADFNVEAIVGGGAPTPEGAVVVGPLIGLRAAWVHAIQIGDRMYLRNGYHRAVGLMEAGHTHMPCLVVHGQRSQLGVHDFPPAVLEGPNPPTVGHFSVERATELQLRRITKMIAITWTEYLVAEQD
jgi:hypothetical protein